MIHFDGRPARARPRLPRRPLLDLRPDCARRVRRPRHRPRVGLHARLGSRARTPATLHAARCEALVRARSADPDVELDDPHDRALDDDLPGGRALPRRVASSWSAMRRTASRPPAGSASTPASRTRTTWPGSSPRSTAGHAPSRCSTPTRASAGRWRSTTPSRACRTPCGCSRCRGARLQRRCRGRAAQLRRHPRRPGRRREVAAAIAHQAEHFDMLGLQLGFAYGAPLDQAETGPGDDELERMRTYVPSSRPAGDSPTGGSDARAIVRSTLDLVPLDRRCSSPGRHARPANATCGSGSTSTTRMTGGPTSSPSLYRCAARPTRPAHRRPMDDDALQEAISRALPVLNDVPRPERGAHHAS